MDLERAEAFRQCGSTNCPDAFGLKRHELVGALFSSFVKFEVG